MLNYQTLALHWVEPFIEQHWLFNANIATPCYKDLLIIIYFYFNNQQMIKYLFVYTLCFNLQSWQF